MEEGVSEKRHVKVLKLHILKPAGEMKWDELGKLLRDARYRAFRLANLAVSEAYLDFHLFRTGKKSEFKRRTIGSLNQSLRDMLVEEGEPVESIERYARKGALPDYITSALSQYKLRGLTTKSKWSEIVRGKSSLPTFRLDMAIPVRCDKKGHRRLEKVESGDVELDLMICVKPYPRAVIATGRNAISDGQREILERLIEGRDDYRHRCFEIKQDSRTKKWHLFVTYDFPAQPAPALSKERIVGVDLGVSCPLYAAINNGHARLGRRQFSTLGARIRSLQNQTVRRRREIQRGGKVALSGETARSGHGRKRKLLPIGKLEGRINQAYTTLNHQLSAAVVKFALDNGAGVIQMENLDGLRDELSGTFIGERWRYEELQRFIEYKAKEAGIEPKKVNPQYTSRRCSECGMINVDFTRERRDSEGQPGRSARFECPDCGFIADPDYNAARNIATLDIEAVIERQLAEQNLK